MSSFPRWAAGSSWLGLGFHTQQFCARPCITLSQPTDHPPTSLAAWLPGCLAAWLPAHPPACHPPACLPPTRLQKLAEKHLPALPDKGGRALPVAATDLRSGHSHALQFKFWANPNSRGR